MIKALWKLFTVVKSLVVLAVTLVVLGVGSYLALCDRICDLPTMTDGRGAVLVGVAERVQTVAAGDRAIYRLTDTTGDVYVLSTDGSPNEGAVVIVWGKRAETDVGRAIVREVGRFSPPWPQQLAGK